MKLITLYDSDGTIQQTTSLNLPLGVDPATITDTEWEILADRIAGITGFNYIYVTVAPEPDQYIQNGVLVTRPTVEKTLKEVQDAKWEQVKKERAVYETTAFPYKGKLLQSQVQDVAKLTTCINAAIVAKLEGSPFDPIPWTCLDNTVLVLDMEGFLGVPAALKSAGLELHLASQQMRTAIYAATSSEQVAAVTWPY